MDSCEAQLEAAKENGIPVIAFDSNVAEKKLVKAYRGTDNVQVGKMAAYQLGSALGKMGKVAVFSAQQKTKSVQDRVEGFMNNIGKYGDIEVVETIYSDQVDDMEASMKEVLEKYPTLDGVFCTNADITEMYLNLEKSDEHDAPALVGLMQLLSSRKQSVMEKRLAVFPSSLMLWDTRRSGQQLKQQHRRNLL